MVGGVQGLKKEGVYVMAGLAGWVNRESRGCV